MAFILKYRIVLTIFLECGKKCGTHTDFYRDLNLLNALKMYNRTCFVDRQYFQSLPQVVRPALQIQIGGYHKSKVWIYIQIGGFHPLYTNPISWVSRTCRLRVAEQQMDNRLEF